MVQSIVLHRDSCRSVTCSDTFFCWHQRELCAEKSAHHLHRGGVEHIGRIGGADCIRSGPKRLPEKFFNDGLRFEHVRWTETLDVHGPLECGALLRVRLKRCQGELRRGLTSKVQSAQEEGIAIEGLNAKKLSFAH
jgi:hypothetical protein